MSRLKYDEEENTFDDFVESEEETILKESGIKLTPDIISLKRRIEEFNANVKHAIAIPSILRNYDRIALLKRQREQLEVIVSLKLSREMANKLLVNVDKINEKGKKSIARF
jgi:hypothetical protein